MNKTHECPICGANETKEIQVISRQRFGDKFLDVPMHMRECTECLSEFSGAEESKKNKREMNSAKKRLEGLLTGEQITAIRNKYHLTQPEAAKVFGGGPVAFCKYEKDDVSQSEAMDSLLRLVKDDSSVYIKLLDIQGLKQELAHTTHVEVNVQTKGSISFSERDSADLYQPKEYRTLKSDEENYSVSQ